MRNLRAMGAREVYRYARRIRQFLQQPRLRKRSVRFTLDLRRMQTCFRPTEGSTQQNGSAGTATSGVGNSSDFRVRSTREFHGVGAGHDRNGVQKTKRRVIRATGAGRKRRRRRRSSSRPANRFRRWGTVGSFTRVPGRPGNRRQTETFEGYLLK